MPYEGSNTSQASSSSSSSHPRLKKRENIRIPVPTSIHGSRIKGPSAHQQEQLAMAQKTQPVTSPGHHVPLHSVNYTQKKIPHRQKSARANRTTEHRVRGTNPKSARTRITPRKHLQYPRSPRSPGREEGSSPAFRKRAYQGSQNGTTSRSPEMKGNCPLPSENCSPPAPRGLPSPSKRRWG